jgi:hypothetical protein
MSSLMSRRGAQPQVVPDERLNAQVVDAECISVAVRHMDDASQSVSALKPQ